MKNLKNLNVVELNTQEVKNVNGGIFPVAIWGAMIAIDAALITVYAMYDSAGKLKH
jgi:lactobin A/cerein 7B family class IIb bacteriocin